MFVLGLKHSIREKNNRNSIVSLYLVLGIRMKQDLTKHLHAQKSKQSELGR